MRTLSYIKHHIKFLILENADPTSYFRIFDKIVYFLLSKETLQIILKNMQPYKLHMEFVVVSLY